MSSDVNWEILGNESGEKAENSFCSSKPAVTHCEPIFQVSVDAVKALRWPHIHLKFRMSPYQIPDVALRLHTHTHRSDYVTGARHISGTTVPSAAFLLRDGQEAVHLWLVRDTSPSLGNGNTHHVKRGRDSKITVYKSKLLATAYKYVNVTDSDSTYQSRLLAFSFPCTCVPKLTFLQNKGQCFSLN